MKKENKNGLVSVIVPVFNTQDYIKKCIESILKNTYSNFELIIIDDGSTDKSRQICESMRLCDSRIQVISQVNQGVSAARNLGIDYANGEYIFFIDSDDYVEENFIAEMYYGGKAKSADIVFCDYSIVNGVTTLRTIDDFLPPDFDCKVDDVYDFFLKHFFRIRNEKVTRGYIFRCAFRTSFVTGNRIRFRKCKIAEDLLFLTEAVCKCEKSTSISKALYNYVQRTGSALHSGYLQNNLLDKEKFINELFSILKSNHIHERELIMGYKILNDRNALLINAIQNEREEDMLDEVHKINNSFFGSSNLNIKDKIIWYSSLNFPKKIYQAMFSLGMYRFIWRCRRMIRKTK